jgi:hypothetical protein
MAKLNVSVTADGDFLFEIDGVVIGSERAEFGMPRDEVRALVDRLKELLGQPS